MELHTSLPSVLAQAPNVLSALRDAFLCRYVFQDQHYCLARSLAHQQHSVCLVNTCWNLTELNTLLGLCPHFPSFPGYFGFLKITIMVPKRTILHVSGSHEFDFQRRWYSSLFLLSGIALLTKLYSHVSLLCTISPSCPLKGLHIPSDLCPDLQVRKLAAEVPESSYLTVSYLTGFVLCFFFPSYLGEIIIHIFGVFLLLNKNI